MTPSRKPERHHTIPKFHIARWADASGLVDLYDIRGLEARQEDPRRVGVVPDINRMSAQDGSDDPWLEHQLFNGFETAAARIMRSIEHAPKPLSVLKQAKGKDIRDPHFLTFGQSVSFGLYVGSLCVRSAAWRDALRYHTAVDMKSKLDEQTRKEIAETSDPVRIAELEKRFGIRLMAGPLEGNAIPWLSGHLAVRLGEVLTTQYVWAVFRVPEPTFWLGDDPVLITNRDNPERCGSYSNVANSFGPIFSQLDRLEDIADRAVEAITGHDQIVVPLDPSRLLVLARPSRFPFPGAYDVGVDYAHLINAITLNASRRWTVVPPGVGAEINAELEREHSWLRERRHERTLCIP